MEALWNAVDISGVATKIGAIGVLVVGIAMTEKGIGIVKRVVRKI